MNFLNCFFCVLFFSFHEFNCLTQAISHTVRAIISVCALEASCFHIAPAYAENWARITIQTLRNVTTFKTKLSSEHNERFTFSFWM